MAEVLRAMYAAYLIGVEHSSRHAGSVATDPTGSGSIQHDYLLEIFTVRAGEPISLYG